MSVNKTEITKNISIIGGRFKSPYSVNKLGTHIAKILLQNRIFIYN